MDTDFSMIASMFKANTQLFDKATQGIPPEKWLTRPSDDSNHLIWIAGHVVVHRAVVLKLLGLEWPAPWGTLFVRGAKLAAAEQYPETGEIQRAWGDVSEKLAASLANVPAEILAKAAPKESPSFDRTVGGQISFLCFHETYHVGQMSYLRKWLGYGQAVG
jgi:hypothetical protein